MSEENTDVTPAPEPTTPQNQQQLDTSVPLRPDNVPEKFWDAEKGELRTDDLLKSYTELEKTKDEPPVEGNEGSDESEGNDTSSESDDPDTASPFDEFYKEFGETGELSEESYKKLEEMGVSKDHVDQYIAGHEAKQKSVEDSVYEAAGGEEQWEEISEWAANGGLTQAELDQFDKIVDSKDAATLQFAVTGLKAKYQSAKGREANLIDKTAPASSDIYADDEEINTDMRDPRYRTDPTFRKRVQQKLARSLSF